jgi:hypothetical protein
VRVRASSRNVPSIALVIANEFCFSTPRIAMHRCVPSMTTPTPSGSMHLQPPAERIDDARQLAQPDDLRARKIGDVTPAEEREQVVLAETVVIDVLDNDHFAVID